VATTTYDGPETDAADALGLGRGGINPAVSAFIHPGSCDALDVS